MSFNHSTAEQMELTELAHDSLLAYSALLNPDYEIPEHIATIARVLEQVDRGELKRVIITIPPRHGKSMLCSQYFPAWYLGRNPDKYLITSTYGQDLSDDFGRKVRDQLESPEFKAVFPTCKIRKDSRAAARFETDLGGTYFGVGAGGPIVGRGAYLLLIDDPTKNREEADSTTYRDRLINWYGSVAYTRLMSGGAVVVIMTRWHEEDLVGHLIAKNSHENWTHIDLPALDESTNTALWPEKYSVEDLHRIRSTVLEYDWHCLYQQNPVPRDGVIFKPDWLPSGCADEHAVKFMAADLAISKRETADDSAICTMGVGYGAVPLYDEIETHYGKWNFEEQINRLKALNAIHKPVRIGIEGDRGGKIAVEVLKKEGLPVFELPPIQDKVTRATSVSHLFSKQRVRINTPALRRQLLSFRGEGEKNDLSDACIHTVRLIVSCSSAKGYTKETDQVVLKTYDERVHAWQAKRRKAFARKASGRVIDSVLGAL